MNVVPFMFFVSLCLVAFSVLFFIFLYKQKDYDHSDRMALAPLQEDENDLSKREKDTGEKNE